MEIILKKINFHRYYKGVVDHLKKKYIVNTQKGYKCFNGRKSLFFDSTYFFLFIAHILIELFKTFQNID